MTLRVGVNATPSELAATLQTFPGMRFCRVFGAPGRGIPAWTAPAMTELRKAGALAWPSFKDWLGDEAAKTMIGTWLDSIPSSVNETWLTYHHEPEGDLNSYEYRRRWIQLGRWVRAHRNAAKVRLVPIHTLYPSRHKSDDTYSTDWTKWVGVWQQWMPLNRDGSYVGDYMGWDCYLESDAKPYEPPSLLFRAPLAAAKQAGTRLVIPELGALRINGDAGIGTGRAAWINACTEYLDVEGVHAVAWWHNTGTNGADYRLSDKPSAEAWRAAINRNR